MCWIERKQLHFKERRGDLPFLWVCVIHVALSIIAEVQYLFPQSGKVIKLHEYRWGTMPCINIHPSWTFTHFVLFQPGTKMELIVLLVASLSNPLFTWSLLADVFFFLDIDTVVIFFPFFNNGFNDAPHYVIFFFFSLIQTLIHMIQDFCTGFVFISPWSS